MRLDHRKGGAAGNFISRPKKGSPENDRCDFVGRSLIMDPATASKVIPV
jgi:hypothetical protein